MSDNCTHESIRASITGKVDYEIRNIDGETIAVLDSSEHDAIELSAGYYVCNDCDNEISSDGVTIDNYEIKGHEITPNCEMVNSVEMGHCITHDQKVYVEN